MFNRIISLSPLALLVLMAVTSVGNGSGSIPASRITGTIATSQTDCTSANTASTCVARDGSGNFVANVIGSTSIYSVASGNVLLTSDATNTQIKPSSSGGNILFLNFAAGQNNLRIYDNGNVTALAILQGAGVKSESDGTHYSFVGPTYTVAGAAVASTQHSVNGTCAFSSSVSCTPTVFSNAAVFASATSYSCTASGGAGTFAQTGMLSVGSQSTTGIIITAAVLNSQTVAYSCTGT